MLALTCGGGISCQDFQQADSAGPDTGPGFQACDASAMLVFPDGTLSGNVDLAFQLTNPDGETAWVAFSLSLDGGETWKDATIEGSTEDLSSSAQGQAHSVTWLSRADTGDELQENLSFKMVAHSACVTWPLAQEDGLTVDNRQEETACSVQLQTPASPQDGEVLLSFTAAHPESAQVFLNLDYSTDAGHTFLGASLPGTDCDGDGQADGDTQVSTSPDGTEHCLLWDSQDDFRSDENVILRLACGTGLSEEYSTVSDSFQVQNDPSPDPDELIFSEILPESGFFAGDYLEIHNRSNHQLDLQGTELARWKSSASTEAEPSVAWTIDYIAGTVVLEPGQYLLLAAGDDPAENGCIDPDLTWSSDFTLNADSLLRLRLKDRVITELPIYDDDGWDFSEGVAMGLDPACYDSGWDELSCWCQESAQIDSCDESSTTAMGSPGAPSESCP